MWWQIILVALVVAVALFYTARSIWRIFHGKSSCDDCSCGCVARSASLERKKKRAKKK